MNRPSKLHNLKKWLTVPETARHLTLLLEEAVEESDVLRLALDGHLRLSVIFVNHAIAKREKTAARKEELLNIYLERKAELATAREAGLPKPPNRVRSPEELDEHRIIRLADDVYDLPMIGGERLDVEYKYQQLTDGPEVTLINIGDTYVDSLDGTRFVLQKRFDDVARSADGEIDPVLGYYPDGGLPEGSVLVVRVSALRELEAHLIGSEANGAATSLNRPLGERERATLLTIIAALAEHAGIDVSHPSKAGSAIEALTEAMGARVAARTIEDHLKRITEVLGPRRK